MMRIFLPLLLGLGLVAAANAADHWSDPTRPYTGQRPAAQAHAGDGMVLQSTIVARDRRLAVVSGRRYQAGDKIGRWQVMAIGPTEVVLRDASQEKRLRLLPATSYKQQRLVEAKPHATGS